MMKKIKILNSLSVVMIIFLSVPLLASADAVPWTTETYRGYAYARDSSFIDEQETLGPPIPLSANATADPLFSVSSSDITTSTMSVFAHAEDHSPSSIISQAASAIAEFTGTYTASDPLFQFIYNYNFYSSRDSTYNANDLFWVNVYDVTDATTLLDYTMVFDTNSSLSGSDVLTVNTQVGHNITVNFGAQVDSYASFGARRADLTTFMDLTYSTAVAPEPISSILFVTGGTLLAGRRYIKRKKKA